MAFTKRVLGAVFMCGFSISGCETPPPPPAMKSKAPLASLNSNKTASPTVSYAFQLIKEGKIKEASQFVNIALQSQPTNALFHVLNGMIYENLAEMTGEQSNNDLAAVGYQNALNIDATNLFAITQLAKLRIRGKQFDAAQELFANALLMRPNDPDLLHELASASYYAYDIKTALLAIKQAEKMKPGDPLVQRSAAMIYASVGDQKQANKHFKAFKEKVGEDPGATQVARRLQDWTSLYASGRMPISLAQASNFPLPPKKKDLDDSAAPETPISATFNQDNRADEVLKMPLGNAAADHSAPNDPQIIVDCYLMRVQEETNTSKGVNLMEGLAVALNPGSYMSYKGRSFLESGTRGASPTTALNWEVQDKITGNIITPENVTKNAMSATLPSNAGVAGLSNFSGKIFTSGLTWGALSYSLNIANAADERTELVSRPSLMTFLKKQSVFFAGKELVTGLGGQFGATLLKYPIGTTMVVTPQKLEDDVVTLNISVEGSLLNQAEVPNLNAATVQVAKTRIDTQVRMRLGDTLMLGGIYERLEADNKKGVPGLREVPLVQYLFSTDKTISNRSSVIIMVTPRSTAAVGSAVDRAMQRGGKQACLNELGIRNPDWFNTVPNMVPLLAYIARDPIIYHEFRSGDVLPPSWGWEPSTVDKLVELESFLYF